jgi:tetratricopeptide (TPR) repeat protein
MIDLDPNFWAAHQTLGIILVRQGRYDESLAEAQKNTLGDLGYVYALVGKRTEAIETIKELEQKYSRKEAIGAYLAAAYVGLGDKDKAFEWLEKDFQARNGKLPEIRWQFQFDSLRDDPRFKDLLKRMGLAE